MIFRFRNRFRGSSGFFLTMRLAPPTWKSLDGMTGSLVPIAALLAILSASRTDPVSYGAGPAARTPA
jgi:hypothetical protein